MKPQRFDDQFAAIVDLAAKLCAKTDAGVAPGDARGADRLGALRERAGANCRSSSPPTRLRSWPGPKRLALATIVLNMADSPVIERLTQALLTGVAREVLSPGARARRHL